MMKLMNPKKKLGKMLPNKSDRTAIMGGLLGFAASRLAKIGLGQVWQPGSNAMMSLFGVSQAVAASLVAPMAFRDRGARNAAMIGAWLGALNSITYPIRAAVQNPWVHEVLSDYSPYDAGGAWPAMSAAYYEPVGADYPVTVGEADEYNTAAVGVWEEELSSDEDMLMTQPY